MTELAKRYGGSLYELAAEEALESQLLEELQAVTNCFQQEPEYIRLLSAPQLPKADRRKLLDEAFGGQAHPYIVNFLKILCDEGHLRELNGCAAAYRKCYNKAHGILEVVATSAVALDAAAQEKLRAKLVSMTGKTIELTCKVDADLLGGIRLDMDGKQLDGTVRHRLDALKTSIAGAAI